MSGRGTRTVAERTVIPPTRRRLAAAVALGCLAVVLVLAVMFHGERTGTRFDDAVYAAIMRHLSTGQLKGLLHLTDPAPMIVLLAAVAGIAAVRRNWRLVAVTVISPLLALLVTEQILKPLVHRTHLGGLAYPSGHESAPACLAAIAAMLVLRTGWRLAAKLASLAALVLDLLLCGIALVGAFYHYATDTVGAVCLSVACVLSTALVVDRQFT
jgi:undecaprenyl-diphosphatase